MGIILPTDHYWTTGMADWDLVSRRTQWIVAPPIPVHLPHPAATTENSRKSGTQPQSVNSAERLRSFSKILFISCGSILGIGLLALFIVSMNNFSEIVNQSKVPDSSPGAKVPKSNSSTDITESVNSDLLYDRAMDQAGMLSGPRKDLQTAQRLFLASAKLGNAKAYYQLGFLCSQSSWPGEGKVESWKWLTLAEQSTDYSVRKKAKEWKEKVSEIDYWEDLGPLTSSEKREGERLASQYSQQNAK